MEIVVTRCIPAKPRYAHTHWSSRLVVFPLPTLVLFLDWCVLVGILQLIRYAYYLECSSYTYLLIAW